MTKGREHFYEVYPKREIESIRSFREPEISENDENLGPKSFTKSTPTRDRKLPKFGRPEKFYEFYRNARAKAADVSDGRSPPKESSQARKVLRSLPQRSKAAEV
ncbi:hypothetical protein NPIL_67391 [Nephila pilipes]|uniref:Uncharacterized protein n=1 Tax=Nephila pilipes TaxID=299642 RepID=A0A8X6NQH0_NEPPI|nr:hypothetical protein NPIL_67391 [Nephila pilipes]